MSSDSGIRLKAERPASESRNPASPSAGRTLRPKGGWRKTSATFAPGRGGMDVAAADTGPKWRALGAALLSILLIAACHSGKSGNVASSWASGAASGILDLYQGPLNHLSAVRYGACPMHPSCSEYARQAIAAYGPLKGWILAMDRLLRCGRDETARAPTIYVHGQPKFYDPLILNR